MVYVAPEKLPDIVPVFVIDIEGSSVSLPNPVFVIDIEGSSVSLG